MPACQNNGICLQPGECACPENFVGTYCEQEKKLCLSPPALVSESDPMSSLVSFFIRTVNAFLAEKL